MSVSNEFSRLIFHNNQYYEVNIISSNPSIKILPEKSWKTIDGIFQGAIATLLQIESYKAHLNSNEEVELQIDTQNSAKSIIRYVDSSSSKVSTRLLHEIPVTKKIFQSATAPFCNLKYHFRLLGPVRPEESHYATMAQLVQESLPVLFSQYTIVPVQE